jgi:hypothetical protein
MDRLLPPPRVLRSLQAGGKLRLSVPQCVALLLDLRNARANPPVNVPVEGIVDLAAVMQAHARKTQSREPLYCASLLLEVFLTLTV